MPATLEQLTEFVEIARLRSVHFYSMDTHHHGSTENIYWFDERRFKYKTYGWSAPEKDCPSERVEFDHEAGWNMLFKEANAEFYGGVYDWEPLFPYSFEMPRMVDKGKRGLIRIDASQFLTKLRRTQITCLLPWRAPGTAETTLEFGGIQMAKGMTVRFFNEADCIAAKLLTVELGDW